MGNTSPIRWAIRRNEVDKIKQMLEEAGDGAGNLIDDDHTADCCLDCSRGVITPLHTSVAKCKPEITELFLQYGCNPNPHGYSGSTPLHSAARANNLDIVKLLLKYNADLYSRDDTGRYPVHAACVSPVSLMYKDFSVLKYLLEEAGCKEDMTYFLDQHGRTPLHDATWWNNMVLVEYLLNFGADINVISKEGKRPIDEARTQEMRDLFGKYNNDRHVQDVEIMHDN